MKLFWIIVLLGWIVPVLYSIYLKRRLDVALAMLEDARMSNRAGKL